MTGPKNCLSCRWEPNWHENGYGFFGDCRNPSGCARKAFFHDDKLAIVHPEGPISSDTCALWEDTVAPYLRGWA